MSGPTPTPDLLEWHRAAMEIIHDIDPDQRLLLLTMVVAPSRAVLEAQEQEEAAA